MGSATAAPLSVQFVGGSPAPPPANCPQLLAAAKQRIADADMNITLANAAMNQTVPKLNAEVTAAQNSEDEANAEFQAATDKYNTDSNMENSDHQAMQNAQANLTNIQNECCCGDVSTCDKTKCVPPTNCDALESQAKETLATDTNTYNDDVSQVQ